MSSKVREIIDDVKKRGDRACLEYTEKFDRVRLSRIDVEAMDLDRAEVDIKLAEALETAKANILKVQSSLLPSDQSVEVIPGMKCQRIYRPLDVVGLYVPGGTAPLISTMMMLALPAKVAGCKKIIVCSPPNKSGTLDPAMLYTAKLCGIDKVYLMGGAQAIAAMAYGTESVPKVCKIFGPGNSWVSVAKQIVAQDPMGAAIDMPAGPSELMVIADESAEAAAIAADLLSQAEHSPDSQVMLCTDSQRLAELVNKELDRQLVKLTRSKIAEQALSNSKILIVPQLESAIDIANEYCPEHLSLQCDSPQSWISKIRNVGTLFLGPYTAESFGDYITGSNHVLPTYGTAKSYSGLSVSDFIRSFSVQSLNREAVIKMGKATMCIADAEGLGAHSNAVKIRLLSGEKVT
jgi:histidinol dehydrogenase